VGSMKDMTLTFLVRDNEVLLAQKKRGFGEGRWNGAGGKVEPPESILDAMVRECQEEIGVTPLRYRKVGELAFDAYHKGEKLDLLVHTYLCEVWEGEPTESEEMNPKWFKTSDIPYDDMWQDDKFWLPQVLEGKKVTGIFTFDKQDRMLTHQVKEVSKLPDLG